jgi:drug/metabolite transporter (DMT)-like permease
MAEGFQSQTRSAAPSVAAAPPPIRAAVSGGRHRPADPTGAPSGAPGSRIQGVAWGLIGVFLWAGSFILTRLGVRTSLNPYDLIALRFGFAGAVLLPVVAKRGFAFEALGGTGFVMLVAGSGAPYALLCAIGLAFAPASQAAALIPGFMTAIVALLGALLLRERLAPLHWASVATILAGCLLVGGRSAGPEESLGHAIFLGAALLWAGYVIVLRRSGLSALQATAIAAVASAIGYLPIYAAFLPHAIGHAPWPDLLLQAVYQGGLTTVLGLLAFNQAVRLLGATGGSALSSLIPVVTLGLGAVLLGERPGPTDLLAACLITGGVASLALSGRPRPANR